MNRRSILLTAIVFALAITSAFSKGYNTYEEFYHAVLNTQADNSKTFNVKNLKIEKDAAEFILEEGTLVLGEPLDGMYRMAYFKGKGSFKFEPPIEIERNQLKRFYKVDKLDKAIKSLFFVCGDSLLYEITKKISPISLNDELREEFKASVGALKEYKMDYINGSVYSTLIDNRINSLFFTNIAFEKDENMSYTCTPSEIEDISLDKFSWRAGIGSYTENICKFNSKERSKFKTDSNTYDDFAINKYDINSRMPNCSKMITAVKIDAIALKSGFSWVDFSLDGIFNIDSIVDSKGNKCKFFKYKDVSYLIVKLNQTYNASDTFSLKLYYQGEFVNKYANYTILRSSMGWYPISGYKNKAMFDLKFQTPEEMKFIAIGNKIKEEKRDGSLFTEWVSDKPMRNASFQIGPFDVYKSKSTDIIPISLYYINGDMKKNIMEDMELAYKFYTSIYGPIDLKSLSACEMYGGGGEAFPGLLHLATFTFQSETRAKINDEFYLGNSSGKHETFVSHETSHQWWGIAVDFESYRDQWLSEGFASYSSYMYYQNALRNNEKFFKFFKDSREQLMKKRKSWIADGIEPGPIALGHRNNSRSTGNDYQLIVYEKGAWVIHMLRNMMIDLKTMKEDPYFAMLKEFYTTYKGKKRNNRWF